jgi:hypothetical protein
LRKQKNFLKVVCLIYRISSHANHLLTRSSSQIISTGGSKTLRVSKSHLSKVITARPVLSCLLSLLLKTESAWQVTNRKFVFQVKS